MRIKIGITDYATSRLSLFMEREGNVYRRAEALVGESAAASGLFADADLHWIYVEVSLNRTGPDGKRLPTHCGRTSAWRHLAKKREYVAKCDINLSAWDERNRKKQGLPALPPADELVAFIRQCLATVIAQVASVLGEPDSAIAGFLRREGSGADAHDASEGAAAAGEDDASLASLEIRFPEGGFSPEAGFARRTAIRALVEEVLARHRLGRFDGASSGGGSYDLGFVVSDAARAVDLIRQGLVEAGHDVSDLDFEIDDEGS